MLETATEMRALQSLLDASHASSTQHLRSIIDDDRVLTAEHIVSLLTGMKVVSLATVTARCEPRISAVDGHFLHATWTFSTAGGSAKARHLQARDALSVAHVDNEQLAVFSHGRAERLLPDHHLWEETLDHWTRHYDSSPLEWGDDVRLYRVRPSWMVGYAWKRAELLAERDISS